MAVDEWFLTQKANNAHKGVRLWSVKLGRVWLGWVELVRPDCIKPLWWLHTTQPDRLAPTSNLTKANLDPTLNQP